ncbi:MAG: hypothetical protein HY651_01790 [Acidobacteria bacterium]|nr:hypothetical protein [Acidobacteriota bacterium]
MENFPSWVRHALPFCLLLVFVSGLSAEPVSTIVNNGNPANRLDLAILGDGYTANDIGKYSTDVQRLVADIFLQEPFREYSRYFNVHRVDVQSNESGADHPERSPAVFRDTALDATYNCSLIQRLICVNTTKVLSVLTSSLSSAMREIVLVIVNDSEYGGSGGSIAVVSANLAANELFLHEAGHSFGLLADEYTATPPPCNASVEPAAANVTRQTERALIKWVPWIDSATPLPTLSTIPALPGLYQGAMYCENDLYRPTYNSKMRNLGVPYEQINSEQLVKRVYSFVSPIDSALPAMNEVTLLRGQIGPFSVSLLAPLTHALQVEWLLTGKAAGSGDTISVDTAQLAAGIHTLEAVVTDTTTMVRRDPEGLLRETQRWAVTVQNPVPVVASLLPPVLQAGCQDSAVTINGSGFVPESKVRWNGNDVSTRFVNSNRLTATILAGELGMAGSGELTVFNPAPGGGTSDIRNLPVAGLPELAPFGGTAPAAGSIVSLLGTGLACSVRFASSLPLPTILGDVAVQLNGVSAPLFFVAPEQIIVQIPWELAGQAQASATITSRSRSSSPLALNLAAAAPMIFSTNSQGTGQGVITNQDSSPNSASHPAARGSVIHIFATGLGAVDPPVAAGQPSPSNPPASTTIAVQAQIGAQPVTVQFAGLAPSYVGLYQVDVVVPLGATPGAAVPLVLSQDGVLSNTVTLAIR